MKTRKVCIFFVFIVCAIGSWLYIADIEACGESNAIGRIIAMEGAITVNHTSTRLDAPLCLGDVIHTGANSRADLELLDSNTIFRIEPEAELRLLNFLVAPSDPLPSAK